MIHFWAYDMPVTDVMEECSIAKNADRRHHHAQNEVMAIYAF
jgi:hypothetical protein